VQPRASLRAATGPTPMEWPEPLTAGASARASPQAILSGAALIAGTTIGAGALALPGATAPVGFIPSSAMLVCGWALMAASGLIVAEVTINTACASRQPGVGLLSATSRTLGSRVGALAGAGCGLVQLALLSAYTAQGGGELGQLAADATTAAGLAPPPAAAGPACFTAALGGAAALSSARALGVLTNSLVAALLASFAALLAVAAPAVSAEQLLEGGHWERAVGALPICVLALVFHNVVPAVARALRGEVRAIQLAVLIGSVVPLLIFILWDGAILGVPVPAAAPAADALVASAEGAAAAAQVVAQSVDALAPLRALSEASPVARVAVSAFSLCAIGTSYLGFVTGQTDVVVDALGMRGVGEQRPAGAYALALLPPLTVALLVPDIFAPALDAAGTFGVTTLYALLPAAIAWQQRYGGVLGGAEASAARVLPGGKAALLAVSAVALFIVGEGALDALGLT